MEKYRSKLKEARQQKNGLASFLSGLTEEERFIFEERAAIMEYDGGLTRAESEKKARACLSCQG
jgi:hypothetical protein